MRISKRFILSQHDAINYFTVFCVCALWERHWVLPLNPMSRCGSGRCLQTETIATLVAK